MLTDTIKSRTYPKSAGIYIFKNSSGDILYVGKAKNLQSRVNSYFRPVKDLQIERPWIAVMVTEAKSIETITVKNETEALLLESTLIKEHEPKYNIRLTDDKTFPYIKAYLNEPIPRISISRKQSRDKAKYFGPFLNGRIANNLIELSRIFYGVHFSNKKITPSDRACLQCQMYGFTCPQVNLEREYLTRFSQALDFLKGDHKNLHTLLQQKMDLASKNNQFELAAKLRDQLTSLNNASVDQNVISTNLDSYDVVTVQIADNTATVGLNSVIEGRLTSRQNFFFHSKVIDQSEVINRFLVDYYRFKTPLPKLLLVNIAPAEDVIDLLNLEQNIVIKVPKRGEKLALYQLCLTDTQNQLELYLLKRSRDAKLLISLKEMLSLDFVPTTIEAVDISNLGESEPVGAIVSFYRGKSDKNYYRKYKIKTVSGQNDFAMIKEVVKRRFNDTDRPVPDIFMVDGGPVQLDFALKGLAEAKTKPKIIISLAKKPDRIFLPNKKRPLAVSKRELGLRLLSQIRDEVHRFVISFQRKRQAKKSLQNT
ncbi:excinuclease ABC subunit UvrC [Candidatus Berkelbacteria bacterium]|nr:excinuclease ABC subunit UvrC [Candidatus Berkelbacteria bacterium]